MENNYKSQWLEIGKNNPWISEAEDPEFNEASFCKCADDEKLLDRLQKGGWCLGQAFHIGDLCFIQQDDGGDEWLTIKGNLAFESISFGRIIETKGRAVAQDILDRIRKATPEQCRRLDY